MRGPVDRVSFRKPDDPVTESKEGENRNFKRALKLNFRK